MAWIFGFGSFHSTRAICFERGNEEGKMFSAFLSSEGAIMLVFLSPVWVSGWNVCAQGLPKEALGADISV